MANYMKCDGVGATTFSRPLCTHNTVGETFLQCFGIWAVVTMDFNTSATIYKSKDFVAINGRTASSHLEINTLEVLINDEYIGVGFRTLGLNILYQVELISAAQRRGAF